MFERYDVVKASDCGHKTSLSIIGTFNKIEDSLCLFMESFNLDGLTLMQKYNATWVYSKNKTKFFKPLQWNEEISIKCFFSNKSLARAVADIVLFNENNEICVYSQIEMCSLDLSTGRIRKLEEFGFNEISVQNSLIEICFDKIISSENEKVGTRQVAFTNIDYNNHTNNIEYLRFVLDTYTPLNFRDIKSIQINYLNQSLLGEDLTIYKESLTQNDIFKIQSKDKDIAICELKF